MGTGTKKKAAKPKAPPSEKAHPELFPLPVSFKTPGGLLGADIVGVWRCGDSTDYAIKGQETDDTVPHNEWFCAHLAEHVNIACPQCRIVQDQGVNYFGSRWEGGPSNDPIANLIARGDLPLPSIAPVLSHILAFDLFVGNEDRRLENLVARDTRSGWSVLCIDHARAWMFNGFPPVPFPLPKGSNTIAAHRELKGLFGAFLDQVAVGETLDRIAATSVDTIDGFIARQPAEWLSPEKRDSVTSWWKSAKRLNRIKKIREGIRDGSYL